MTGVGTDAPRDFREFVVDTRKRIVALERRQGGGSGGGSAYDSGWVELKTEVTFASGWSLAGSVASVKARRVGAIVQMVVQYASVAAGTFSVPTSGNITNNIVLTGIPAEFRPAPGTQGAAVTGNTGATASFQVSDVGELFITALAPDATLTASTSNVAQSFTIVGTWMADGSKPLGPGVHEGESTIGVNAGVVSSWSGPPSTVPFGWLLCDGSAIPRAAYPALFAAIGTTYGAGDGSTTFNVPNGKGRVIVGQDAAQVEFDVVGEVGGTKTETLTIAQMPRHQHNHNQADGGNMGYIGDGSTTAFGATFQATRLNTDIMTGNTGGGGAHNNLQPYLVQNWIISTGAGSTPPVAAVLPVDLWQEFTLTPTPATQPPSGPYIVWNGTVSGNLGATLSADKITINLPSAGTYRVITHFGLNGAPNSAANTNSEIGGQGYAPSNDYGANGPASAFVSDLEYVFTTTGPQTFKQAVNATALYYWTWIRFEKIEPFYPTSPVLAVTQGSTALRDSIYGIPGTDATKQASLANRSIVWYNTDKGWFESYYAVTGTAGLTVVGLLSASVAGWYPTGQSLYLQVQRTTQQATNGTYADVTFDLVRTARGITFTVPASTITLPFGGVYEFDLTGVVSQSPAGYYNLALVVAGTTYVAESGTQFPHTNAYSRAAIDYIMTVAGTTSASMRIQSSSAGNLEANSGRMSVKYLGPPLAN